VVGAEFALFFTLECQNAGSRLTGANWPEHYPMQREQCSLVQAVHRCRNRKKPRTAWFKTCENC